MNKKIYTNIIIDRKKMLKDGSFWLAAMKAREAEKAALSIAQQIEHVELRVTEEKHAEVPRTKDSYLDEFAELSSDQQKLQTIKSALQLY